MEAVSRAELLASLSLTIDLGLGQPMEHVLRQTVIAMRLADLAGYDTATRNATYYASLLAWIGCNADSSDLARLFGDDLRQRAESYKTDLAGLPMLSFVLRNAGGGNASPLRRLSVIAEILATGWAEQSFAAHCESAAVMADRLDLSDDVHTAFLQLFERFDGKGAPNKLKGEAIVPAVRLLHLADIVEVFDRMGGTQAAVAVAKERRGKHFDPSLVDCFADNAVDILDLDPSTTWSIVIGADPALGAPLSDAEVDSTLATFGDFVDIKSPYFVGHSRRVADLAGDAADRMAMRADVVTTVRRAGWVHDLGVMGVSNSVWDYAGTLATSDRERMQTHPYLADRTLSRVPALAPVARLVAQHHERADGSGYPSALSGDAIAPGARVLAAADAYTAWREPRPYRDALSDTDAANKLRDLTAEGKFDPEAADAVLRAAGQRSRKKPVGPAGLTPREIEVLICLARGQKNKEIAAELHISAKTVSAHIERIYTKANVTTRATATLFAMKSGLLDI